MRRWARKYDSCIGCSTVEDRHWAKGRCKSCYYKAQRRERGLKKVHRREHKWIEGVECKYCPRCKEWKSLDKYCKNPNTRDSLCAYCGPCKWQYDRSVSKTLKEQQKHNSKVQRNRSDERKQELLQKQGGHCYICELSYRNMRAYDLHHIDPSTKEYLPSVILKRAHELWIEESKKCKMICATCHRLVEDLGEKEAREEVKRALEGWLCAYASFAQMD